MRINKIDVRKVCLDDLDGENGYQAYRQAQKDLGKKCRVHIFPEGESIFDQLSTRRTRPYELYREQVIPSVLEKLGLEADTKVEWSQKAGCPCGCSPGFIIPSLKGGVTVYVDVDGRDAATVQ